MHTVKLILNATMVSVLNLASFVIGFFIFRISGSGEQRLIQGTAALIRRMEKAPEGALQPESR